MKILIPHPHLKPHHVKHAAATLTVSGGALDIFSPFPHVATIMLVIAGCIAIYEPHLVHELHIDMEEEAQ